MSLSEKLQLHERIPLPHHRLLQKETNKRCKTLPDLARGFLTSPNMPWAAAGCAQTLHICAHFQPPCSSAWQDHRDALRTSHLHWDSLIATAVTASWQHDSLQDSNKRTHPPWCYRSPGSGLTRLSESENPGSRALGARQPYPQEHSSQTHFPFVGAILRPGSPRRASAAAAETPTASQGARQVSRALANTLNTDPKDNVSGPFAKSGLAFPSLSGPRTGAAPGVDRAGRATSRSPGLRPPHPRTGRASRPRGLCDISRLGRDTGGWQ